MHYYISARYFKTRSRLQTPDEMAYRIMRVILTGSLLSFVLDRLRLVHARVATGWGHPVRLSKKKSHMARDQITSVSWSSQLPPIFSHSISLKWRRSPRIIILLNWFMKPLIRMSPRKTLKKWIIKNKYSIYNLYWTYQRNYLHPQLISQLESYNSLVVDYEILKRNMKNSLRKFYVVYYVVYYFILSIHSVIKRILFLICGTSLLSDTHPQWNR